MRILVLLISIVSFLLSFNSFCWSENYTQQSIGSFDYISGSDGYSGTGQQIGGFYFYGDNE